MNETKKTTSIAWKINRGFLWQRLGIFLTLDIILLLMLIAGWCYLAEAEHGLSFSLSRSREFLLPAADSLFARLDGASYVFEAAGKQVTVFAGHYFHVLRQGMYIFLALELLLWLGSIRPGIKRIRRGLRPLDDMALTARRLMQFDDSKFRDLEAAISRISPDQPDERLSVGDRDLMGLEAAVNSLLDRMRESYQQQSRFVSDASHELRTPLAVIQGYADMLARWGKEDEKVLEESITAIQSETAHMKKLMEQLLFLARGDGGRTSLTFQMFSLTDMMGEVYEESRMIDEQHTYRLEKVDGIRAYGDTSMLKQTARILIDNAAKYTPPGQEILLRVSRTDAGEPCFTVQDAGIGMNETDAAHMFDRFFRSDMARNRQSGGTGLGLSIAKWIVDRHGGYFTVISREEIGTRVSVVLPRSPGIFTQPPE